MSRQNGALIGINPKRRGSYEQFQASRMPVVVWPIMHSPCTPPTAPKFQPGNVPAATRRQALHTLAGLAGPLALAGLLPACTKPQPIAVAAHVWVGYAPMFLARELGLLDPAQASLTLTANALESVAALRAGQVQAAALTLDEALVACASGLKLVLVLVFNESLGADMLLGRPPMANLAGLAGARLGYENGSVGEIMLQEVLQAAGLRREQLQLVNVPVDAQAAAWKRQALDAVITYEPVASELLAQGAQRLFDSRQIPHTILDVLAVRADALPDCSAALTHLVQVHFLALQHLRKRPQDAAYRLSAFLGLPAQGVQASYKGLLLPDAAANRRLLDGSPPPLMLTAQRLLKVLHGIGLVPQLPDLDGLIRANYLPVEVPA